MPKYPITEAEKQAGIVNIAMHAAFFPRFQDWVHAQGLGVSPPISAGEDPEPETFRIITVPGHLLGKIEAQTRT